MSISVDAQKPQRSAPTTRYDVVVVGAGPYGLATAAHLLARGLNVTIFGRPMQLWRENMPAGMLLRSYWWATSISDAHKQYDLEQYFLATDQQEIDPLPIGTLIDYGLWFQKRVVPDVDETYVETIEHRDGHFVVTLVDGRVLHSSAVVMAPGLRYYIYRPGEYDHLPTDLVSHSSDHHTFDRFIGKRVVVIGGGQGALETAALAYESGADVQLVSRSPIHWICGSGSAPMHRPFIERLRNPKAGISYGWFNWGLEHLPYAFQQLPRSKKDDIIHGPGRYGPMGASWLKPRLVGHVPLYELQQVEEIKEVDDGVVLELSNKTLEADHVILGTGYRVDVRNLPMLHPSIVSTIQTYQNAAILNNRFESSVSGLYFVGISSVSSCGPLYRFVVGTESAARRVADAVAWQVRRTRWRKRLGGVDKSIVRKETIDDGQLL